MTVMMQQQQQILLQVLQRLAPQEASVPIAQDEGTAGPSGLVTLQRSTSGNVRSNQSNYSNNGQSRLLSNASALPAGNAVSWLASQIPEFGGSDDENVEVWSNRVDKVAEIHGASDGITLLAASSKLVKFARQWYEIQTGEIIESWQALKTDLLKMFKKQVSFYKAMQKLEARKWIPGKESFDQYAIAKLALMKNLNLPTSDAIHMLIGGISQGSLRAIALSISDISIDGFLAKMRTIAEGNTETDRKSTAVASAVKSVNTTACRNCGKKRHSHKDCRGELTCFYCKSKGHRQFDCPKVKDRNGGKPPTAQRSSMATVAAAVTVDDEEEEVVACVSVATGGNLEITEPFAEISSICGKECKIRALVDTGSPVSFVDKGIYLEKIRPFIKNFKLPNKISLISAGNG
ncbi:uncharacterized protein [Linepithema humile]|uniref:uncharacterized protein n=1 Tax=Linepithema humile TaxID=83485 RepID=UPI00351EF292